MSDACIITGVGPLVFAGAGRAAFLRALAADPPPPAEVTGFECPEGAPTAAFELTDFDINDYSRTIQSYIDRTSALAVAGARLALEDADLLDAEGRPWPLGLAYATTWGCLDSMRLFYVETAKNPRRAPPLPFSHSYANSPSSIVAIEYELKGFAVTLSAGLGCGLAALAAAARAISAGEDAVLVGASDALSEPLYRHALGARMLSPSGRLTPDGGDGTVLGEGAAFLVLESARSAEARGAQPRGTVECFSAGRPDVADSVAEIARAAGTVDVVFRNACGIPDIDRAERAGLAAAGDADARFIKPYTGEAWSVSALAALIAALETDGRRLVIAADPGGAAEGVLLNMCEKL